MKKLNNGKPKRILIYTDGSLYKGLGGYAYYIECKIGETILGTCSGAKGYSGTTISRMEMRAIIYGLKRLLPNNLPIQVISDSEFIIKSLNCKWVNRWENENFEGRKNSDLWIEMLSEIRRFEEGQVKFLHTRGHDKGSHYHRKGNNIVDELCSYKNFEGQYLVDKY